MVIKMEKYNYLIKGMTCAACSARIENAIGGLGGVTSCVVNLSTERMTVLLDSSIIGKNGLEEGLSKTGYGWEEIFVDSEDAMQDLVDRDKKRKEAEIATLRIKLIGSIIFVSGAAVLPAFTI